MSTTDRAPASPSQRVAALITAHLPAEGEVVIAEVAERVARDLVALDDVLLAWLRDRLADLVYNAVQVRIARTRRDGQGVLTVVATDDERTSTTPVRVISRKIDWLRWMEHVRDRHIPLGQMRRPDLRAASRERIGRGHQEIERGALWAALADRLPDDATTVGDHFDNAAIDALAAGVQVRSTWTIARVEENPPPTTAQAAD
jgi:hypothetical protein